MFHFVITHTSKKSRNVIGRNRITWLTSEVYCWTVQQFLKLTDSITVNGRSLIDCNNPFAGLFTLSELQKGQKSNEFHIKLETRSMQNADIDYHVAAQLHSQQNTTYVFHGALPLYPAGCYAPRTPLPRASRSFSFRSFVIFCKIARVHFCNSDSGCKL